MRQSIAPRRVASVECDEALVIVALGYERRARNCAETILAGNAAQRLALAFTDRHLLSFDDNYEYFSKAGYQILEVDDRELLGALRREIGCFADKAQNQRKGHIDVRVDVSSFSRLRLAIIVQVLAEQTSRLRVNVEFCYSLAAFEKWERHDEVITTCGPVTRYFAGWPLDASTPVALIVGLGYEDDRAIGIMEYLAADPRLALILVPAGRDGRYDRAVTRANIDLFRYVGKDRVIRYSVGDPESQFDLLESLLYGLQGTFRAVLVPFGPKIFAVATLLAATAHDWAGVWRVSPGTAELPVQRVPSGEVVRLRVALEARPVQPNLDVLSLLVKSDS